MVQIRFWKKNKKQIYSERLTTLLSASSLLTLLTGFLTVRVLGDTPQSGGLGNAGVWGETRRPLKKRSHLEKQEETIERVCSNS